MSGSRRAGRHDHRPGNPANQDCRTSVCRRTENIDLTRWKGAVCFSHRQRPDATYATRASTKVGKLLRYAAAGAGTAVGKFDGGGGWLT